VPLGKSGRKGPPLCLRQTTPPTVPRCEEPVPVPECPPAGPNHHGNSGWRFRPVLPLLPDRRPPEKTPPPPASRGPPYGSPPPKTAPRTAHPRPFRVCGRLPRNTPVRRELFDLATPAPVRPLLILDSGPGIPPAQRKARGFEACRVSPPRVKPHPPRTFGPNPLGANPLSSPSTNPGFSPAPPRSRSPIFGIPVPRAPIPKAAGRGGAMASRPRCPGPEIWSDPVVCAAGGCCFTIPGQKAAASPRKAGSPTPPPKK